MLQTKTLREREKELQSLLATPAGRKELKDLESHYNAAGCRPNPAGKSAVTYIIVCERERGLIID